MWSSSFIGRPPRKNQPKELKNAAGNLKIFTYQQDLLLRQNYDMLWCCGLSKSYPYNKTTLYISYNLYIYTVYMYILYIYIYTETFCHIYISTHQVFLEVDPGNLKPLGTWIPGLRFSRLFECVLDHVKLHRLPRICSTWILFFGMKYMDFIWFHMVS